MLVRSLGRYGRVVGRVDEPALVAARRNFTQQVMWLANEVMDPYRQEDRVTFQSGEVSTPSSDGDDHGVLLRRVISSESWCPDPNVMKGVYGFVGPLVDLRAKLIAVLRSRTSALGYEEVFCPCLVSRQQLEGTGQLPRFENELVSTSIKDLFLSPTGEVQLGNIRANGPKRLCTLTRCYRREMNYGRDFKGLLRNYEFEKMEIFRFEEAASSPDAHLEMLQAVTGLLAELGFVYRVLDLGSLEIGFGAYRTFDVEVWFPRSRK